jgi:hypothetical protein
MKEPGGGATTPSNSQAGPAWWLWPVVIAKPPRDREGEGGGPARGRQAIPPPGRRTDPPDHPGLPRGPTWHFLCQKLEVFGHQPVALKTRRIRQISAYDVPAKNYGGVVGGCPAVRRVQMASGSPQRHQFGYIVAHHPHNQYRSFGFGQGQNVGELRFFTTRVHSVKGRQVGGIVSQQGIRFRNPELFEDRPRRRIGKRDANSWRGWSCNRRDNRGRNCFRCPGSVL